MRGYGGREEGGPLRGCEDAWQGCRNPQRVLNLSLVEAVTWRDDLTDQVPNVVLAVLVILVPSRKPHARGGNHHRSLQTCDTTASCNWLTGPAEVTNMNGVHRRVERPALEENLV